MPSNKIPNEMWDHILSFCDHQSGFALSKVNQRLAEIVSERNEYAVEKCRKTGIALPSDEILSFVFGSDEFPLDFSKLERHNPFGRWLCLTASTVRGFESIDEGDERREYGSKWNEQGVMERGALEFGVGFDEIGIPRWIIDGLRPTIRVSAVLQRRNRSCVGRRISASMGVWRIDRVSPVRALAAKETIQLAICTVENGKSESRFEIQIDPTARIHGHAAVAGSDALRINISSGSDVIVSDVRIRFDLPEELPPSFFEWLHEAHELRNLGHTHRKCSEVGLFGL
ncbi:hypothetical protein PFISCL1PPCAC_2616 [Pristionchus fissidentatus]|uniref:F-box domain-containing protein n=1 Tax=Pristionchus fissidentatus TaxID=1538716 RepID=A0AAV5V008_9BILA|nr:hypothetical protein PFISCL1PPCAC_2616 [Pristionchus fissidentatus]